ncbi:hypothetical protein NG796_20700 [Laspinema sp. A4]|uniref:hypothetical protein n=1 Tax=Laspinema sp. D2d TaxID=2953686 RepID=UPI0021BB83AC|nr:hypothetical protein [Laspinema sp. D2d]MCT7985696.1 hypothetical protein [Laspinema sp. D2d]
MTKDRKFPEQWPKAQPPESGQPDSSARMPASSLSGFRRSAAGAGSRQGSYLHLPPSTSDLSSGGEGTDRIGSRRQKRLGQNRRAEQDSSQRYRDGGSFDFSLQGWRKWLTNWQLWALITFLLTGGLGGTALLTLLRLPAMPNCGENAWTSGSEHLYCAQQAASEQTVDGLLRAIAEVHQLPEDHPLRPEINRQIEKWAGQLLDLAEKIFNEGKLTEAISSARQIPPNTTAAGLVQERITRWQSIWNEAEKLYKNAESELEKENWNQALGYMRQLLSVENTYWETVRYDGLSQLIRATQQEGQTLNKARSLAEQGDLKNITEAIALVEKIEPQSKLYKKSRSLATDFAKQILALARKNGEDKKWEDAIYIARQVPNNSSVKKEAEDFIELTRAKSIASRVTVRSLEDAIAKAQVIGPDRPLHLEAKRLISQWQDSIKDVAYLEQARNIAMSGNVNNLRSAIAQAQLVSRTNLVWDRAQEEINEWQSQIEESEDRPYLRQAEQLASYRDRPSLQAAIDTARNVGSGRALYAEAQDKIEKWSQEIQRLEDQPILDRAWNLAQWGNVNGAIATAQAIRPGRLLYTEAQSAIQTWQQEGRDRQLLDRAYQLGDASQSPERLMQAMDLANQVSSKSNLRFSADAAIQDWSQRILGIAQQRSLENLPQAIELARMIPSYSNLYNQARREVEAWETILNPPPVQVQEVSPGVSNSSPSTSSFPQDRATDSVTPPVSPSGSAPNSPEFATPSAPTMPLDPIEGVGRDSQNPPLNERIE